MDIVRLRNDRGQLVTQAEELIDTIQSEKRTPSHEEEKSYQRLIEEIESLGKVIEIEDNRLRREAQELINSDFNSRSMPDLVWSNSELHENRLPKAFERTYRAMFCPRGESLDNGEWRNFDEFAIAVRFGRIDERLNRALVEGMPSDGGFAVPTQFAAEIFDVALESEIVRPKATIHPMTSNEKKIPATVIGDHSSNVYGGVVAYWKGEGQDLTSAEPSYRSLTLMAQKLTVYGKSSSEWLEDAVMASDSIQRTFANGLSWYLDKAFLKGTGTGQPLGVLNSDCLVEVEKLEGQVAGTINYSNVTEMFSRLHPACYKNAAWIAHPTTIPQILRLSVPIGAAGAPVPVLQEKNGQFILLTRPIIFSEKMEPLGSKGDILLADFSQYAIGLRGDMRLESSMHVHFQSDEIAYRAIIRVDGQPLWDESLTLEDGSTTVSPFIVLEERS